MPTKNGVVIAEGSDCAPTEGEIGGVFVGETNCGGSEVPGGGGKHAIGEVTREGLVMVQ